MLSLLISRFRRVAHAAFDRVGGVRIPAAVPHPAATLAAAGLIAVGLAAGLVGCDRAPDRLLLPGTGERDTPAIASIAGTVAVPGVSGALPAVKVWAFRDVDSTYVSAYTAIQVVGNYTDPVFSVGTTPVMQRLVGGAWVDSITINPATLAPTAGQMEWKFVTNKNFDSPPDYGVLGAQVDGLVGTVVSGANGPDGNIIARVTTAGAYYASLDEKKLRYSILPWDEGPVAAIDRTTGAFTIDLLKDGNYIVVFTGPGLLTRRVVNVRIIGGAGVNIGTVNLRSATTAITGQVEFAGNPDPRPTATVQLLPQTGDTPLNELTSPTGAFAFSGLDNGSYRVRFRAVGFTDSTVAVNYGGTVVDLGTITLKPGYSSAFTKISVIGDFPGIGWDPLKQVDMTQVSPGVWTATVPGITTGCHYMKFRTNDNWETPDADYGGTDPLEACVESLTGPVGTTTTLNKALQVNFPADGAYTFTLNEQALTYAIAPVVVVTPGTLTGTVSFSGAPPAGLKAFVQVLVASSGLQTASDSTASRYTFNTLSAGEYKVRFSARGYLPDTIDVSVTSGQTTEAGNTELISGYISAFTRIAVIGDFPTIAWTPDNEVALTQVSPGLWRGVVTGVPGGDYYMKFRTNGNWETPDADYTGTDVNETLQTSLTGPVMLTSGLFSGALHIQIPAGSQNFEFTLDEQNLTYSIVEVTASGPGRVVR